MGKLNQLKNKKINFKIALGYKTIPDKPGYLEIDEEMAKIVRAAFTAFLREGALAPAAIWLNENGYRLRKDMEGGGRLKRVGHFTVDNLQAMLRNKVYLGIKVYRHRGEEKEAKAVWPALIDEVTFQRIGKILDKNRRRYKPHKQGRLPYVLTGICHCMNCNSPMPGICDRKWWEGWLLRARLGDKAGCDFIEKNVQV